MKFQPDCIPCAKKQGQRIYSIATDSNGQSFQGSACQPLADELNVSIDSADRDLSPADLSYIAIRAAEKHAGNGNPFETAKKQNNDLALSLYDDLKARIRNSNDPLHTACQISACGNIIDLGPQDSFDIHATLEKVLHEDFRVSHIDIFRRQIEQTRDEQRTVYIAYICDNAGEIGFDRLLIEELQELYPHVAITAVVRGGPILNDATMEDAKAVGLPDVVRVIGNGNDYLGTRLDLASDEFQTAYREADIVISKGQANYESLSGRDENIFFILKAKCNVIAASLGVQLFDAVMAHQTYVKQSQLEAFGEA